MEDNSPFKLVTRRKLLNARRKTEVLSKPQSSNATQVCSDEESNIFNIHTLDHGKEIMSLLQNEQMYIECLKHLSKVLLHPSLIGGLESSGKIGTTVEKMLSVHEELYRILITGNCNVPNALKKFSSCVGLYETYSILIGSNISFYENISEIYAENGMSFTDILQEPISHIVWFKKWLKNLLEISSSKIYHDIFLILEKSCKKIYAASSSRKNVLRLLRIQKLLLHREPKIVSASRIIIEEGFLYKVSLSGRRMKKFACFLFSDIFLLCKVISKSFDWQKRNSLTCYAVLPLTACSVTSIVGSNQESLIKVVCGNMSFLLHSEVSEESKIWFQNLQDAIKECQNPSVDLNTRFTLRRTICIRGRMRPFIKRYVKTDSVNSLGDESVNFSPLQAKPSLKRKLTNSIVCVQ